MTTTIITAIYDDYDQLKPALTQSIDCRWICVTDSMIPAERYEDWEIVFEPRLHLHPNLAAKTPKMLPWLYTPTSTSIWIDASYQVVSKTFAEDVLHYADPIAQFKHPWRNCAYLEARESSLLSKYADCDFEAQRIHLEKEELPNAWGLWATGVIARQHTPEVVQMGFDWLADVHLWSFQDQVSHPLACYKNGIRPVNLPGSHLANEWLAYQGSMRHL